MADDDPMPELFGVAVKLKPGQISKPFQVNGDWEVIKVTDRLGAGVLPFDVVRETLARRIEARKTARALRELSTRLFSEADVVWFIDIDQPEPPRPDRAIGRPELGDLPRPVR